MNTILLIEDNQPFAEALYNFFSNKGIELDIAFSGEEGIKKAEFNRPFLILLDLFLPDVNGIELIPKLSTLSTYIIVLTAGEEISLAVNAMKAGAFDFISKNIDLEALYLKIKNLLNESSQFEDIPELIGASPAIKRIKDEIKTVAKGKISVLIVGETGVGKDLVARAIHRLSRRKGNFVDINSASIPEPLFESELFGYEKGAFTGASLTKKGLFQEADGGTLFMDEITELPKNVQSKLLRALETGEIRPLGSNQVLKMDVRFIGATNLPMDEVKNKLRKDLFYRISSYIIEIPPLRERKEDISDLARHFMSIYGKEKGIQSISHEAEKILFSYHWPGNVRELKNEIEKACLLCTGRIIDTPHLSERLIFSNKEHLKPLRVIESEYIKKVLKICGGNKSEAARILGISRFTLRKKIENEQP